ncbi:MAG TPA: response regulator transcription factor [Dehalococcoidia bacterium]|nr:response regulator transcription factor [Dehalococcoidia bacterium]
MEIINVLIIDRSEIFRAGICQKLSLQRDFKLLDCDPNHDLFKIIESRYIRIVLLDIDNPISNGLDLARKIIRHYPNTGVIVLSPYFNDDELFEAIKIGAIAYTDKSVSTEDLVTIIKRASRGEYVINDLLMTRPLVAERVLKQFQEIATMGYVTDKVVAPLTQREIQILGYIANGNTNKEIAHILGISDQTIKNHVSAILRKLNANDRAHAVAMAMQHHWISVDDEAGQLSIY